MVRTRNVQQPVDEARLREMRRDVGVEPIDERDVVAWRSHRDVCKPIGGVHE